MAHGRDIVIVASQDERGRGRGRWDEGQGDVVVVVRRRTSEGAGQGGGARARAHARDDNRDEDTSSCHRRRRHIAGRVRQCEGQSVRSRAAGQAKARTSSRSAGNRINSQNTGGMQRGVPVIYQAMAVLALGYATARPEDRYCNHLYSAIAK